MVFLCPNCFIPFEKTNESKTVCRKCGYIAADSEIVVEQTFTEVNGASVADGVWVSGTGRSFRSTGPGMTRPSHEVTLDNARRKIQHIGAAVGLLQHHFDAAQRLFMLAVQHNFTQGRRSNNVVAACLYVVCRRERTPHMLIDFADVLQTNVYTLGHTYLKFCQVCNVQMPILDPSLYIQRFAAKLEFGELTQRVANTALRLVQSMKRDWIQIGRRPSGICGASLLIAARLHGQEKTVNEVVRVVRIGNMTLKRRMSEFSNTAASTLTPQEFDRIDLEVEADPPAYQKSLLDRRNRVLKLQAEMAENEKRKGKATDADAPPTRPSAPSKEGEEEEEEVEEDEPICETDLLELFPSDASVPGIDGVEDGEEEEEEGEGEGEVDAKPAARPAEHVLDGGLDPRQFIPEIEELLAQDEMKKLGDAGAAAKASAADDFAPGKKLEGNGEEGGDAAEVEDPWVDGQPFPWDLLEYDDGSLDELDDEELGKYVRTPEEVRQNLKLWMTMHKEFLQKTPCADAPSLEDMESADLDALLGPIVSEAHPDPAAQDRERQGERSGKKKRKRGPAVNATEAVVKELEKKVSKKVNYAALQALLNPGAGSQSQESFLTHHQEFHQIKKN